MKKKYVRFYFFLILAILVVLVAFEGYRFAPFDPLETDFAAKLQSPSRIHLMGTDQLGRDVFSRVLYGARSSFALTFLMTGLISVIGTWIGMISGYYGGKLDTLLMRLTDVLLAFPDMIFAIAVAGMLGPGILNTVLALSCIWWTKYARMARGLASVIRTKEYIMEAHLGGAGNWKILMVYIFPNIVPQMIVMAALDVGGMMLALAGLSFLGLASQPPFPEWGVMLYEGKSYIQTAPWMIFYAGAAIFLVVFIFNLLGDSLRDLLDPKEEA